MKNRNTKATADDLPAIFPQPPLNTIVTAKLRIHQQAVALAIEMNNDALNTFALLLVALEQE